MERSGCLLARVGAAGLAVLLLGVAVFSLVFSLVFPPGGEERAEACKLIPYILVVVSLALVLLGAALIALSFDLDEVLHRLREHGGGDEAASLVGPRGF